jgi:hypothetical protein
VTDSTSTLIPNAEEVPVCDLWPTAGQALGLSRQTTYDLADQGEFPIEVLRIGRRRKVRTVELRRYVGLDTSPAA